MKWLTEVFRRSRLTAAERADVATETVTFARDWATTPTGLHAGLGRETLSHAGTYHTNVITTDEVALTLSGHPDARAVIIEAAADGRPVVECSHCLASMTVEDFNLAMLISRVKPSGVC